MGATLHRHRAASAGPCIGTVMCLYYTASAPHCTKSAIPHRCHQPALVPHRVENTYDDLSHLPICQTQPCATHGMAKHGHAPNTVMRHTCSCATHTHALLTPVLHTFPLHISMRHKSPCSINWDLPYATMCYKPLFAPHALASHMLRRHTNSCVTHVHARRTSMGCTGT